MGDRCVALGLAIALCAAPVGAASAATQVGAEGSPAENAAAEAAPAGSATLDQAERLIQAGQSKEAYALLAPLELDWSGDPRFDYLLGLAALDSGRPGEAVFSLERVVAARPDFMGARMELARANYEAGELDAAQNQFDYLLKQNPPDTTRGVIERYEAAIANHGGVQDRITPYVEVGAGYDSNANGSTSESQFLGFTLNPENVKQSSSFVDLAAGFNHVHAYSPSVGISTDARVSQRWDPSASFVNQTVGSLGSRVLLGAGAFRGSVGVDGYYGLLDGDSHDWGAALELGGSWLPMPGLGINAKIRGGPVRYLDDALEVQDVTRYFGTLGASYAFPMARAPRVSFDLIYGQDKTRIDTAAFSNHRYGVRAAGSVLVLPAASAYVEAGWLRTDYDDYPGFFGFDRIDYQDYVLAAVEFQGWPVRGASIAPRVRYIRNNSNLSLYEYERVEAGVYARYFFR